MTTKINLGLIGCGSHSVRSHVVPALRTGRFSIGAIYDPSEETVALVKNQYAPGAISHASRDSLLDDELVQALIIASPDEQHIDDLWACRDTGHHVLVEKPIAVDAGGIGMLVALTEVFEGQKRVLTSCHPRRFDPPFRKAREYLPIWIGKYGDLLSVDFDFFYPQSQTGWKNEGRSLLLDHFGHEIDLLHFLVGHAEISLRMHHDSPHRYEVVGVRPDDGITICFRGTRLVPDRDKFPKIYPERLRFRFERGDVTIDTHWGKAKVCEHDTMFPYTEGGVWSTDYDGRFDAVAHDFADAIEGNKNPELTAQDLIANNITGVMLRVNRKYTYKPHV